jgi:hypothetical protein
MGRSLTVRMQSLWLLLSIPQYVVLMVLTP